MHGRDPEGEILVSDEPESCGPDHVLEDFLLREAANALHQVLVRVPVAGKNLTHRRDDLKQTNIFLFFESWKNEFIILLS